MSDAQARDTGQQREAVVHEITQALGDAVERTTPSWWQYFFIVTDLGADAARALAEEARALHAQGGMATKDGTRKRTAGGIFFVLAKDRLGPKQMRTVRGRADRRFKEEMLRRFLRLLALVVPPSERAPAAAADDEQAPERAVPPRARPHAAPTRTEQGRVPPPRRRPEPVVEVVMVRRRRP